MIYVHVIWQIHDVKTDIQVSEKEMLLKFKTREEYDNSTLADLWVLGKYDNVSKYDNSCCHAYKTLRL